MKPHYKGLNLIEVLMFFVMFLGVFAGVIISEKPVLGGFVGLIASFIAVVAWALLSDLLFGGFLPKCRQGGCDANLFHNSGYEVHFAGEESYYVCRHGGRYKRRGKRFLIVNDDGTESPYLVWRPFRGWFPDVAAQPPAGLSPPEL